MKTNMTETSLDAYDQLDLTTQQQAVLDAIKLLGASCIADVATHLRWERSTVSGRMNDLKKAGRLFFAGKQKSETTGILSEFWTTDRKFKVYKGQHYMF